LGNSRTLAVYLPPSYDENLLKRYRVLYMQDGQNLFDPATSFAGVAWEIDAAFDTLAATTGVEEAIVVGPYNSANRTWEYNATMDPSAGGGPGGADAYLDFLRTELAPWVETQFRTLA